MLGVFAKVVRGQHVKTRLQGALARPEAERFHVCSLADTLETALRAVETLVLFLRGGEDPEAVADLRRRLEEVGFDTSSWSRIHLGVQRGADLGERLERAFVELCARGSGASSAGAVDTWSRDSAGNGSPPSPAAGLIIGSDSPSLDARVLRRGLESLGIQTRRPAGSLPWAVAAQGSDAPWETHPLQGADAQQETAGPQAAESCVPDVVLGPTLDGGYWAIGVRRPHPGLLRDIAWSSRRTLQDTMDRARRLGLRLQLLATWTDVDRPEDLHALAGQIAACRGCGDTLTARHSEMALRELGFLKAVDS